MDENCPRLVSVRHNYLPLGEEIQSNVASRTSQFGADANTSQQRFTGKEHDGESRLDHFGARYHGSALGRWTSPDIVNVTDARMQMPSSTLNKYVYGANNPLKYIDPDGRDVIAFYSSGGIAGHFYSLHVTRIAAITLPRITVQRTATMETMEIG